VTNKYWKAQLLIEMISRAVKENIRTLLKKEVSKIKEHRLSNYKLMILNYLNVLLGESSNTPKYWDFIIRILQQKFRVTTTIDLPELQDERKWKILLLLKISTPCGLCWSDFFRKILDSSEDDRTIFSHKSPFLPIYLQELVPHVRTMNIAYLSKAYLLKTAIDLNESNEILSRTVALFKSALHTYTRDKHAMVHLGHLFQLQNKFKIAEEYYNKALLVDPDFKEAKIKYISLLQVEKQK